MHEAIRIIALLTLAACNVAPTAEAWCQEHDEGPCHFHISADGNVEPRGLKADTWSDQHQAVIDIGVLDFWPPAKDRIEAAEGRRKDGFELRMPSVGEAEATRVLAVGSNGELKFPQASFASGSARISSYGGSVDGGPDGAAVSLEGRDGGESRLSFCVRESGGDGEREGDGEGEGAGEGEGKGEGEEVARIVARADGKLALATAAAVGSGALDRVTIDADGQVYVTSEESSTSPRTGSITVEGGLGVAKSVVVGGNVEAQAVSFPGESGVEGIDRSGMVPASLWRTLTTPSLDTITRTRTR